MPLCGTVRFPFFLNPLSRASVLRPPFEIAVQNDNPQLFKCTHDITQVLPYCAACIKKKLHMYTTLSHDYQTFQLSTLPTAVPTTSFTRKTLGDATTGTWAFYHFGTGESLMPWVTTCSPTLSMTLRSRHLNRSSNFCPEPKKLGSRASDLRSMVRWGNF